MGSPSFTFWKEVPRPPKSGLPCAIRQSNQAEQTEEACSPPSVAPICKPTAGSPRAGWSCEPGQPLAFLPGAAGQGFQKEQLLQLSWALKGAQEFASWGRGKGLLGQGKRTFKASGVSGDMEVMGLAGHWGE